MSQFLDDVAEDEDGDEDEDEDEDYGDDAREIIEDSVVEEGTATHRALEQAREKAELEAQMKHMERFETMGQEMMQENQAMAERRELARGAGLTELDRAGRLPSNRDPKLWMVRVKSGQERMLALKLMNKFVHKQGRGKKMGIKSVIVKDHLRGYIFIEARKEDTVKAAISGIRDAFINSVRILPMDEMVDVLTVAAPKDVLLKKDAWVRVKRGKYKGDIGRIFKMDDSGAHAYVKLIPRLDLEKVAPAAIAVAPGGKRKRKPRPAQKFFNAKDFQPHMISRRAARAPDGTSYQVIEYNGEDYIDGYVLRRVPLRSLYVDNVAPTLAEFQAYTRSSASENPEDGSSMSTADAMSSALASSLSLGPKGSHGLEAPRAKLHKSDKIQVTAGELKSLTGTVLSVDGESVTITADDLNFSEPITLLRANVAKHFQIGDHVRVVNGIRQGETGHVVHIDDIYAHVYSDISRKELKVFIKDIRLASSTAAAAENDTPFEVFDLVELNPTTVGVVINITGSMLRILNQSGIVVNLTKSDVTKKQFRRPMILDSAGNSVAVRDIVRVLDGPHQGKQGTVKHIFRAHIFAHSQSVVENGGMFTVRGRNCALVGGSATGAGGAQTGPAANTFKPRGRRRRDELLYKQVVIKTGPNKGYLGTVSSVTDVNVRVQLNSKNKCVSVPRSAVARVDDQGQELGAGGMGAYTTSPGLGNFFGMGSTTITPDRDMWSASQAPKTPMMSFGNMPQTPMRPSNDDGGLAQGGWGGAGGTALPADAASGQTPGMASAGPGEWGQIPFSAGMAADPYQSAGPAGYQSAGPAGYQSAGPAGYPSAGPYQPVSSSSEWGPASYETAGTAGYGSAASTAPYESSAPYGGEPSYGSALPMDTAPPAPGNSNLPAYAMQGAYVSNTASAKTGVVTAVFPNGSLTLRYPGGDSETVQAEQISRVNPSNGDPVFLADKSLQATVTAVDEGEYIVTDLGGGIHMYDSAGVENIVKIDPAVL